MRITNISVKGLFGMFDHEIPLNQESRITIIHGPNGVGKTITLRLLHDLFSFNYDTLRKTPFGTLQVKLEEGKYVGVWKVPANGTLSIRYTDWTDSDSEYGVSIRTFEPHALSRYRLSTVYDKLMDEFPEFKHIYWNGKSYWIAEDNLPIYERGFHESKINEHTFTNNPGFHSAVYGEAPDWFFCVQEGTRTYLLNTERLDANMFNRDVLHGVDTNVGLEYSTESFDNWFRDGFPAVEELEIKFRNLIEETDKLYWAVEELEQLENLYDLAAEEARIKIDGTLDASMSESRLSARRRELAAVRHEIEQKYQDVEYLQAILLLQKILNERFLFKSVRLTTKSPATGDPGFKLQAQDGSPIPMEKLSSGEQQLLVLYYQLLLEVELDSLVMIDEPELSMNVVWQRNFLKDLQRIIELRKFDVLIATHSPMIIHDKWDWVVHLGEKVDD